MFEKLISEKLIRNTQLRVHEILPTSVGCKKGILNSTPSHITRHEMKSHPPPLLLRSALLINFAVV